MVGRRMVRLLVPLCSCLLVSLMLTIVVAIGWAVHMRRRLIVSVVVHHIHRRRSQVVHLWRIGMMVLDLLMCRFFLWFLLFFAIFDRIHAIVSIGFSFVLDFLLLW